MIIAFKHLQMFYVQSAQAFLGDVDVGFSCIFWWSQEKSKRLCDKDVKATKKLLCIMKLRVADEKLVHPKKPIKCLILLKSHEGIGQV